MSSKVPKKVDFFNGGRGVKNVIQFDNFETDSNSFSSTDYDTNKDGYAEESNLLPPARDRSNDFNLQQWHPSLSQENKDVSYSTVHSLVSYDNIIPQYSPPLPQGYLPIYAAVDIHTSHPSQNPCGSSHFLSNGPVTHSPTSRGHCPLSGSSKDTHGGYPPLRAVDPNGLRVMGLSYSELGEESSFDVPRTEVMSHSYKSKKRQQKCSLCCNHGFQVDVKGHKWFCPFRNCDCERCQVTRGRQHHMKEQQKLTRHLQRMQ